MDSHQAPPYDEKSPPYDEQTRLLAPVNDDGPTIVDPKGPSKGRQASLVSSIINLSNTILGAGMLSLPYAVATCGAVLGALLLVFCALASAFGLYLLILCSDHAGEQATYYVCAKRTYPKAAFIIDLIVFVKCFGVAISYLVIVGDLLPLVCGYFLNVAEYDPDICDFVFNESSSILINRHFWIGLSAAVIIPIAFLPTLNALRFTSALALGAVGYLVGLIIAEFARSRSEETEAAEVRLFTLDLHFFKVMTIFVFGFTCHQNIFSIYNEIVNPTHARMKQVIGISIGSSLIVYLIVGLLGFIQFGERASNPQCSNVLTLFDQTVPVTIGRILVTVLVIFSYPLQSHPDRICLDNLYKITAHQMFGKDVGPQSNQRFFIETCFILAGTFGIAFATDDLSVVISLVGAIGSTAMCYILPGLFYLKFEWDLKWGLNHYISIFLVVVGCFVMPTAIVFVFVDV